MQADKHFDGDIDGLSRSGRDSLKSEGQEWQERSEDLHSEEDRSTTGTLAVGLVWYADRL